MTHAPDHRFGETTLTVVDAEGNPIPDADITVEQTRHAFAFGNIGFDFIELANGEATGEATGEAAGGANAEAQDEAGTEHLADLYTDVFNTATLPFYWGRFEPERGAPDTARLLTTAQWFRDRGIALKGHPLVWHTVQPDWLLGLPLDEVEQLQRERIRREVSAFAGTIDTWDAINEVVIMPVFDNGDNAITPLARAKGRIPMIQMAFEEARAANPRATLLLNDFDLSSAYECLIEGVLEAGVQIDAIGLQTHMHQGYWGEDTMLAMVDRFARYGLPLHLTETSLVSGDLMPAHIVDLNDHQVASWPSTPEGEARQADDIERHYRSLVGHPSVEAITYWGITDAGAWLGAPIGLVRADGTPKPSYDALRRLVKEEWWLGPTVLRTDDRGRVQVRGFRGDYRVDVRGTSAPFTVTDVPTQVQIVA
ncbi:endo-1,4-beta-xylanase [Curtobacterium flaccumfaciens pv. flaccumfaciens]|uniref:endo-1,4-beta-xylanase n=1 Tax=Curtobacterium flaccumfaciens TaxID=2035 RepID=UPI00217ED540|nr:endo-1,4-beta-xylanase [Curtobacterium flaccumfaciens]MCS6569588.1 endo-1,4-beta-xylanase [Curtobacterium flaccumfaciens pv. flaccumfaciens]MCS6583562.1 endo-1,4-beta-xylanase [Curtobacterium flaccumfaciens pv. flaccumfaciens]